MFKLPGKKTRAVGRAWCRWIVGGSWCAGGMPGILHEAPIELLRRNPRLAAVLLAPLVIDADSAPPPGTPGLSWAAPELAVLAALTGAAGLENDAGRRMVLSAIAASDTERLKTYNCFCSCCRVAGGSCRPGGPDEHRVQR
jgi:hypothetical protein